MGLTKEPPQAEGSRAYGSQLNSKYFFMAPTKPRNTSYLDNGPLFGFDVSQQSEWKPGAQTGLPDGWDYPLSLIESRVLIVVQCWSLAGALTEPMPGDPTILKMGSSRKPRTKGPCPSLTCNLGSSKAGGTRTKEIFGKVDGAGTWQEPN